LQNGAVTPGPQDSLSSPATPYQMIPAFYDTNGALRIGSGQQAALAIKNPPKKTHPKKPTQKNPPKKNPPKKTHLKKPTKKVNKTKISFIYQKIVRYALN
jgi:hypothetical protein